MTTNSAFEAAHARAGDNDPTRRNGAFTTMSRPSGAVVLDDVATVGGMTRQTDAPIQRVTLDSTTRRIEEWARQAEHGEIDMSPPYQRGDVWTQDQRIALIESFMRACPSPRSRSTTGGRRSVTSTDPCTPSSTASSA